MNLDWPDCLNARDLVGLPVSDGSRIRAGALLRSDNHDRLTDEGIDAVRRCGLGRILDLRWEWECRKHPSPFAKDPLYRHISLVADGSERGSTEPDVYRNMIDDNQSSIATAFVALAEAPEGAVLVHCHGGRDRTGVLVALALAVAGVPEREIVADYALTEGCRAETMRATLTHLCQRHQGVHRYLTTGGANAEHFEAVRARLVD